MPLTEMTTPGQGGGGGLQVAYGSPSTLSTSKVTTGFKPKYIVAVWRYTTTDTMACFYNEDVNPDAYIRVYRATYDTQTKPWSNSGFASIDEDGFTMRESGLVNFTYLAVG